MEQQSGAGHNTAPHLASSDIGNRRHQIFPTLSEEQFDVLLRYGERQRFAAGTVLFRQGDRHISMYVIISGSIEVERGSALGSTIIGTHGPGMFTGEMGALAGRAAVATARVVTDSELIVIDEESLRTLVISEAALSETIMRAFILRRVAYMQDQTGGVVVFGARDSQQTLVLRHFLNRNGQPAAYFDTNIAADDEAHKLMTRFGVTADDIPAVVMLNGEVLRRPTLRQLADGIGISPDRIDGRLFDVVVVGAGPAGLAAAVYAASEGLSVAVLDAKAPGGQAGSSSKIENYFGFPTGITGQALAGRGLSQARKFGAEVAVPVAVSAVKCDSSDYDIEIDSGEKLRARSIVIASGARYRKPNLPELERFEGRGVYYSASFMEANFCADEEVVVVGGGNSAGQAAVFLSAHAKHVHIVVRSGGLAASMSRYLIQRIEASPKITLHTHKQIVELRGTDRLESICWQSAGGEPREAPARHLFLFLGAEPSTAWLNDCVLLDDKNFVLTGPDVPAERWPLERQRHFLETSRPRIFAVGDVRSGSVKRVAAAVGEGSAAVASLHQALASDLL
ncbi:FAD-dependent oxidoreductase [Pseudoduganella sp. FT25W]|jgi:thioredoxin reductase (NADPH)|uniref:FAD-dependent oxidoreductase n=1 Tax=Duganella alba TaxID=2666081 RepID=A0A6L5QLG7_9BURK|nr:cyclic nucleotide-binding domain-containing thioredoxin-disulfide reductase [Duganella alba]MRX10517.1 FAD-dependent oxidoreductase [Duganella alba]MRX18137.1 FAD-dependent oxidoreductase [Duganella alba]